MHVIHPAIAHARLREREHAGQRVDPRLIDEVGRPGVLYIHTLADESEFLCLVWQSVTGTRPLAPIGSPRTLRDCALRLDVWDWSFQRLVNSGYGWFQTCADLDEVFDMRKFDWVAVVPMNEHETVETPAGNYYIFDGVHKSLVIAKRLLRGEAPYIPVNILLLTPRR